LPFALPVSILANQKAPPPSKAQALKKRVAPGWTAYSFVFLITRLANNLEPPVGDLDEMSLHMLIAVG